MDGCSLQVFVATLDLGSELVPSTSKYADPRKSRNAEGFSCIGVMVV